MLSSMATVQVMEDQMSESRNVDTPDQKAIANAATEAKPNPA
jgi:hypothetical protein